MNTLIEVTIPVEEDAAQALQDPARRAAAGRYLSTLLRDGGLDRLLAEAIADLKKRAHDRGLTDPQIEAELEAWRDKRTV